MQDNEARGLPLESRFINTPHSFIITPPPVMPKCLLQMYGILQSTQHALKEPQLSIQLWHHNLQISIQKKLSILTIL